jgi:hypothetical protein
MESMHEALQGLCGIPAESLPCGFWWNAVEYGHSSIPCEKCVFKGQLPGIDCAAGEWLAEELRKTDAGSKNA